MEPISNILTLAGIEKSLKKQTGRTAATVLPDTALPRTMNLGSKVIMSTQDFKAVARLKLSQPVPEEMEHLVKAYMKDRPEWLKKGLESLLRNSGM